MYLSHVYNILFNKNIDDKQLKSFDTTDFLNYINNMLENINNYNDDTKLKIYETYQDLIIDSNIKNTHKTLIDTINNTNNLDEKRIESIINDLHIKIMINRLDFNNLKNSLNCIDKYPLFKVLQFLIGNINDYDNNSKLIIYERYKDLIQDDHIKQIYKEVIDVINNGENIDSIIQNLKNNQSQSVNNYQKLINDTTNYINDHIKQINQVIIDIDHTIYITRLLSERNDFNDRKTELMSTTDNDINNKKNMIDLLFNEIDKSIKDLEEELKPIDTYQNIINQLRERYTNECNEKYPIIKLKVNTLMSIFNT